MRRTLNNIYYYFILFVLLWGTNDLRAQVAVSSAGATVFNAYGEVSYTMGQTVFDSYEGTSTTVYIGVQQPYCQPSSDTMLAMVCQNSGYSGYGFDITASQTGTTGTYTFTHQFVSEGGCDSVVTLSLMVNPTFSVAESFTQCDSFLWQGHLFTESIDTSVTLSSAMGCDSICALHLTIHHSSTSQFEAQGEYTYTWGCETYDVSGFYQQSFLNQYGCDSTVTADITIIYKPIPVILSYDKRVLIVDHYPNGPDERVDYDAYTWYRDEAQVSMLSRDQYYENGYPVLSGCYYVKVPANPEQTRWVRSNTICMENLSIEDVDERGIAFVVMPNPVLSGHDITVSLLNASAADIKGMRMKLFDNAGRTLLSQEVQEPRFSLNMPYSAGYYTLYLYMPDGSHGTKKIIVHR